MGNIAGLRYKDGADGMTANLFSFCIAGSSTGKESIQKSFNEIMSAAGMAGAIHGGIKSEQETIRNLTRNQAAFYCIDEFGIVLKKLINASKGGGTPYLEGVIGLAMSAYSKADSFLPINGDLTEDVKEALKKELASCNKKIDENEDKSGFIKKRLTSIERSLSTIDQGLERPFLSILGFTTPVTFNGLIEFESATNGFLSRALIFEEADNNPRRKERFKKVKMSLGMQNTLANMPNFGHFDATDYDARIEFLGEQSTIESTDDAMRMMDRVYNAFWAMADEAQSQSGLEAIPRRGYELVAKISFILGIPEGIRQAEHVRWAFALVKNDIERKMRLAHANINEKESPSDSIAIKIQGFLSTIETPQKEGTIVNRCRPHEKDDIKKVLAKLVELKKLEITECGTKRKSKSYSIK